MTPRAESPSTIAIIVGGLVTSAIGIGVVWATGHLPPTVPGGIVLLLGAAVLVAAAPRRWAPLAGTCFGLYVTVGFVVNGRVYELIGHDGVGVALGRSIQLAGVLAAVTAGAWGVLARYRAGTVADPAHTGQAARQCRAAHRAGARTPPGACVRGVPGRV